MFAMIMFKKKNINLQKINTIIFFYNHHVNSFNLKLEKFHICPLQFSIKTNSQTYL